MPIYTGQLGSGNSYLGNFVLGVNSLSDNQISEALTFVESVNVNLKGVQLSESFTLSETLTYRIPQIRKSVLETLVFTENLAALFKRARNKIEAIGLDESLTHTMAFTRVLTESLTLVEDLVKSRFLEAKSESLTLAETLTSVKVHNRILTETLIFAETLTRSSTYRRTLSETLTFVGGYVRRYGNGSLIISYPEVRVIKKENLFVIKGYNSAITLPNPQFDDSESTGDILTVYRSMSNQIYTFVKVQPFRKLTYSFIITRQKAIELRKFFDNERANKIEVQNHKTEIWIGYLITNPIVYTATKLAEPCGEQVEVSLDFEAIRVI